MTTVHQFPAILTRIVNGSSLAELEAETLMRDIMAGALSSAQIAALAVALRAKGETTDEIAGFVRAMRAGAVAVPNAPADCIDTCGTGGDGLHTFNISTVAALVAAAAGVTVAKHGNRAASSKAGSADVLEALDVVLELPPEKEAACLRSVGIAFLFARAHHPALKHAAPARKEIGIRTVFNIIGPLTNPAGARTQLMGLCPGVKTSLIANALAQLDAQRAMVVQGADGMDEISLAAETEISELRDGAVVTFRVTPEQFGLSRCAATDLVGGDAQENAAIVRAILGGENGPRHDIVTLNAGAAIYLAGKAASHAAGIVCAREAIASGTARRKLDDLVAFTKAAAQ